MFLFEKSVIGTYCNRLHNLKESHSPFSCYGRIKANSAGKNLNVTVTIIISGIFMLLSRVDVVFCFGHYFRYFPVYKPSLVYFILKAILLVAISRTPPVDQPFLIDFICVFTGCSLGSSFRYSPVFKPFLVNF